MMNLVTRRPFNLDWWFDELPTRSVAKTFTPACDVVEKKDNYVITLDIPGLSKDDVRLEVKRDVLEVTGERTIERDADTVDGHIHERAHGKFERSFSLPDQVDTEKIEAKFKDGELRITLPKTETSKTKLIPVS